MADVQGPAGSPNPKKLENQVTYTQDYRNGIELFQKSLSQASKSEYQPQKEQFHDVMQEAMEVLNQAAQQMKNQSLLEQNQKISEDFQAYTKDPSKANEEALRSDLNDAKHTLEE